ncbi:hypothetical protein [Oceanobacillus jordanicus]|uniref:hypothetical protein n=1 Tax=Oceanobacillus jordanicus TaxID=2867266 RepID=UPI001EDD1E3E|nr:hypothetical protein [Oceanobacillus jordanicus]
MWTLRKHAITKNTNDAAPIVIGNIKIAIADSRKTTSKTPSSHIAMGEFIYA